MLEKKINFFCRDNHPYYIATPPYRQSSGGIRAMHYLCNALNQLGMEAYILTTDSGINPFLHTPELTPEIRARHEAAKLTPISVYPEGITTNILQTPVVARWLLNKPPNIEEKIITKEMELVFYWDEWIIDENHKGNKLRIPIVDRRIFRLPHKNDIRKGYCFYANKYLSENYTLSQSVVLSGTSLCLNIPRTPEEIAEILQSSEALYCYEPSSIVMEALLCGCPVAYVNSPYLDQFHWDRHQIFKVDEDEVWSVRPPPLNQIDIDNHFKKIEDEGLTDLLQFIELTQSAARKIAIAPPPPQVKVLASEKSKSAYELWLEQTTKRTDQDHLYQEDNLLGVLLTVICNAENHQLSDLADTIDSPAQHARPRWNLVVISNNPSPMELDDIAMVHWIKKTSPEEAIQKTNEVIKHINSPWIIEIPCGCKIDERLNFELENIDQTQTKAIFFDDDLYNQSGARHSPRFKPGVNPAALMSCDLAGPICVELQTWLSLEAPLNNHNWYERLLQISRTHGWSSFRHIPKLLLSHTENGRTNTEAALGALDRHLTQKGSSARISMVDKECWSIIEDLPAPPPKVDIFVHTQGDTGLLERCIKSITTITSYTNYELKIINETDKPDQSINKLISLINGNPLSIDLIEKHGASFCYLANEAIKNSSATLSLFINDECVAIQQQWLDELVRVCSVEDENTKVAGASPRLIRPGSRLLENTGYILGLNEWRDSPFSGKDHVGSHHQYNWVDTNRDITTLTPTCFIVCNEYVKEAGFFENDSYQGHISIADLSLKLHNNGYRLLYAPRANIAGCSEPPAPFETSFNAQIEFFTAKRNDFENFKTRWWPRYANDPYWNRNLSLTDNTPTLELEYIPDWFHRETEKPKILAHILDNVQGNYRISAPLDAIKKNDLASSCIWKQRRTNGSRYHTASEILRLNPDVHIIQNYIHDKGLAALDDWRRTNQQPFTVYALDDVITDLDPSNPYFKNFAANSSSRLKYALARCDRMVVSTEFIANLYQDLIQDIRIVPNRIEKEKWLSQKSKKRAGKKPRIGWAGGTTHHQDLMLLKEVIEKTRDQADWVFFGMCPDEIRPLLAESHPPVEFAVYPDFLASLNLDIGVAPLAQTVFNRGKSNLRLLELGILGLPVVCTNIDPYRDSPACLVSNSVEAWVSALRDRIHNSEAREAEGQLLRRWVIENYLLEDGTEDWLSAHLPDEILAKVFSQPAVKSGKGR